MTFSRTAVLSTISAAVMLLAASSAQAQNFSFFQLFNNGGVVGTLSGSGVGLNPDLTGDPGIYEAADLVFQNLSFVGTVPTLGATTLTFAVPNILVNAGGTTWFPADRTLGGAFNGFFLSGTSLTGTQMTWASGPLNNFAFGNDPGTSINGDLQGSTNIFGSLTFFSSITTLSVPIALSNSNTYVNAIPEPSTYLMMLGGIAALSFAVRRRVG